MIKYYEFRRIIEEKFDAYTVMKKLLDEDDVTVSDNKEHRDFGWFFIKLDNDRRLEFVYHYKDDKDKIEFNYDFKNYCSIINSLRQYYKENYKSKSGDYIFPSDIKMDVSNFKAKINGTYYFDTEIEFYTFIDKYIISVLHGDSNSSIL